MQLRFLHETGETESCRKLLEAAYLGCELCPADDAQIDIIKSHLLNTDGLIAWQALDYERSEEAMEQAAEIRTKRLPPDDDRIAGCFNNLGSLWAARGQFTKALEVYLSSETKIKSHPSPTCVDLCRASLNLARLYRAMREPELAREKLSEARVYLSHKEMQSMPLWVAAADFIAGDIHHDLGELDEAKTEYVKALQSRECHQPADEAVSATKYKLACVLVKLGETVEAK
jgi:tetratricopeptide (TPR) repeat protein